MGNLCRAWQPKPLVSAILVCGMSVGAWAQGEAQPVLEEVVVTARKRAESIQDVPISISAFSGNFLKESSVNDLQQLATYSPNFYMSKSSQVANQRIIIRGVGSAGNNAIEPSVAVFIDGVYYPRPSSVVGNLQDIEQVEVLKGPQGTLFGRNASMGALNITTRKPTEDFYAEVSGSYGNYDATKLSGVINGGLADSVAGRLAVSYFDRDGYGKNTLDGKDVGEWEDQNIRGALRFDVTDRLDVTLTADWHKVDNGGPVVEVLPNTVIPRYIATIQAALSPDIPVPPLLGGSPQPGPLPEIGHPYDFRVNQVHNDTAEDEQWGLSADVNWRFADGYNFRSITAYRKWENDTFEDAIRLPLDLFRRVTRYETETFSQEFQVLSPTEEMIEWVAGLYYYQEDYTLDQDFDFGPSFCVPGVRNLVYLQTLQTQLAGGAPPATANAIAQATAAGAAGLCSAGPQVDAVDGHFNQDVKSYAAFAQSTWHITDRLDVTGGVRYSRDDKEGEYSNLINNIAAGPAILNLRAAETTPLDFDDDQFTWLLNVSYDITEDLMVFATYATGYKAGGFNAESTKIVLGPLRTFDSEEVDNIEVGVKTSWWDGRVNANLTAYRTDIDEFQDRQFNGLDFIVKNAGELRQQGAELDVTARPVDQLLLQFAAAYLDSEFLSFDEASPLPGFASNLNPQPQASQNLKGKPNSFSPKWRASLVAQWTGQIPDAGMEWFIRGEYNWTDDQNVNAQTDNNPQTIQDDYGLLNARLGLRSAEETWEVAAWARNIEDKGYCQTIFYQPLGTELSLVDPVTGGGMARCVLGEPRTYGIDLTYRFK